MPFDKHAFQNDLRSHIPAIVQNDLTINQGQLNNVLEGMEGDYPKYDEEHRLRILKDNEACTALRLLLVYYTFALTLGNDDVYAASLEIFPMDSVNIAHADLILDVLNHTEANPTALRQLFQEDIPSELHDRLDALRAAIRSKISLS
jgi:hypothetical protein